MTDLSITVNGMKFDNPFVLGSGPPGTNGKVIARVVRPRLGRHGRARRSRSTRARSSTPRRATRKLRGRASEEVIGFENIELISDRPYAGLARRSPPAQEELPEQDPDRVDHGGVPQGGLAADRPRGPGDRRRRLRAEPVVPARPARAQDGHGDGREPRHRRGGRRLGEAGRDDPGVGEDDAERRQPDGAGRAPRCAAAPTASR